MGRVGHSSQWRGIHDLARIVDIGRMARIVLSFLVACGALGGCAQGPPSELAGLWSRSAAACAAGAGVRFEADAVRVYYGRSDRVLFDHPRYALERRGGEVRVRIDYGKDGGPAAGESGRLVLHRTPEGWIRPVSHQFADKRTGAVSERLAGEDVTRFFTLQLCAPAKENGAEP